MAPSTTSRRSRTRREAGTFRVPPLEVIAGSVGLIFAMLSGFEKWSDLSVCDAFAAKATLPRRSIGPTTTATESFPPFRRPASGRDRNRNRNRTPPLSPARRARSERKGTSVFSTGTEDVETSLAGTDSEPPAGETIPTTTTTSSTPTTTSTATARADDDDPGSAAAAPAPFWNRLESLVFGFLDGDATAAAGSETSDDDPRRVLARWEDLWECDDGDENSETSANAESDAARRSLEHFLEVWAKTALSSDRGLTTPVSCAGFRERDAARGATPDHESALGNRNRNGNGNDNNDNYDNPRSMKLIFRPPKRYLSYKEQKSMEKGVLPDRKGAKVDAWSPGGVEITVSTTTATTTTTTKRSIGAGASNRKVVGVTVRRCDIDGDTVIKKTTERAIVRRLEEALRIWKRNRAGKRR